MGYFYKKIPILIFLVVILLVFNIMRQVTLNGNFTNVGQLVKSGNANYKYTKLNPTNFSTYIIFINGLGSSCNGTNFQDMCFGYIRKRLTMRDFDYYDKRFLMYSYAGGEVNDGKWFPNKYDPKNTGQPIEISIKQLNDLIEQFSVINPNARFILVGYSLGGRIAFEYISKYAENNWRIKGVVTLNTPLVGSVYNIPDNVLDILHDNDSIWGSIAVRQLISENKFKEETHELKRQLVQRFRKNGVHIATFATRQDLIVPYRTACLRDSKNKLITEGGIVSVNRFGKLPYSLFGHRQIFEVDLVIDYIISILEM